MLLPVPLEEKRMRSIGRIISILSLVLLPLAASGASAQARTFKVDSSGGSNIQFVSDATLEKITGVTSKASGDIIVDPAAPAGIKGKVLVEVASIRTNIDLRDEHLRSDSWLDAKKCPNAEFVITSISGVDKLKPNEAVDADVKGKFTIHCVTKDITTKAKVRWVPAASGAKGSGDTLRVQASFVIMLEHHKVSIPAIVALKVSPKILVNVDLRAASK